MTIAAILKDKGDEVFTVAPGTPVRAVVAMLAARRIGAVPVLGHDGLVAGVFSERDVIRCLQKLDAAGLDAPVEAAMSSPVVSVAPHQSVIGALGLMTQRRFRHLPVVDGGRLIGFVSIGDLVKYRIDRIEADAAAMRDYIQSA